MERNTEQTVLVVGAGPVGLMAAIELSKRGVPVRIIDQNDGPTDAKISKALAIHCRTAEIFEDIGLGDVLTAKSHKVTEMCMFSKGADHRLISIPFAEALAHTHFPYLQTLRQGDTEQILIDALSSLGVQVERKTHLNAIIGQDQGGVDCQIGTNTERYAIVIGADGPRSVVRKDIQVAFEGNRYEEHFFLADVHIDWEISSSTGFLCFFDEFVLFSFPLDGRGNVRIVVNELNRDQDGKGPEQGLVQDSGVTIEEVEHFVHQFKSDAKVSNLTWGSRFNISHRVAEKNRVGRVFLIGDAAHVHSPAGGQGMNTGLQDAHNLAWQIAEFQLRGAKFDIFDTFQVERKYIAEEVVQKTHSLTQAVTIRNSFLKFARNFVIEFAGRFKAVQYGIALQMSELQISYQSTEPENKLIRNPKNLPPVPAGTRARDVKFSDKSSIFSHYQKSNRSFVAILVSENPEKFQDIFTQISERFPHVYVLRIITGNFQLENQQDKLVQDEGEWTNTYGCCEGIVVIRPDNYVGFFSWDLDAASLDEYLSNVYPVHSQQSK